MDDTKGNSDAEVTDSHEERKDAHDIQRPLTCCAEVGAVDASMSWC